MNRSERERRRLQRTVAIAAMAAALLPSAVSGAAAPRSVAVPGYVGSAACGKCHAPEYERWRGSHHDLAMQKAKPETVLGDFSGKTFEYAGVTTTFSRRGTDFVVRTDGPDGKLQDYVVEYAFGVDPLQQYLIALPGGRLQALSIAWDSRPRAAGGQRWFHLYPNERIDHTDVLHWTKPSQNWNQRCAVCHSTALVKNYDPAKESYATTWAEVSVGCEACHGPGAEHVRWADARAQVGDDASRERTEDASKGLAVPLGVGASADWRFAPDAAIARRERPRESSLELETCAPCHARRSALADGMQPGRPFLDAHRPALLEEGLYHADGQIQDEVYEYGSFLQSRMHVAGVTCSECHDPHSLKLRAEGNALCARCHLPEKFDTPEHYFHAVGSPGSSCAACHMPARTYMVVDDRRDHGFRIPRPDLTVRMGIPNACGPCHVDRSPAWAAAELEKRFGPAARRPATATEALDAGRKGAIDAEGRLARLVTDRAQPAIVRASAVQLFEPHLTRETLPVLAGAIADPDPLVRMAAADVVESLPPPMRPALAGRLLRDPVLAVRIAAASSLAGSPPESLDPMQRTALDAALAEARAAHAASADAPEANLSLGALALQRGDPEAAERFYRTAIRVGPSFVPAYMNLADLRRAQGRDDDGEQWLRKALALAPEDAGVHHALGLLLVRAGKRDAAIAELRRAVELAPGNPRFAYVLGIALHSSGDTSGALVVMRAAAERRPADRELLFALATVSRDAGDLEAARTWAARLLSLDPSSEEVARLAKELESQR